MSKEDLKYLINFPELVEEFFKIRKIDDRAKSVKDAGYNFEVWVYNDKKMKTKTQIF